MGHQFLGTSLSSLERADGSATYSCNGCTIVAAVNGPIEVQRRDELPEEAVLDVVVRPVAGIGGVRERYLESIIRNTLRHVVLVTSHPRTLIQVILQVVASQEESSSSGSVPQSTSGITVLPALFQSSMLALLSSSIPLKMTLTSTIIAAGRQGELLDDPTPEAAQSAVSLHVLGFSSKGDLLVDESEGNFSIDIWEKAFEMAKSRCQGAITSPGFKAEDVNMEPNEPSGLEGNLKLLIQHEVSRQQRWKNDLD